MTRKLTARFYQLALKCVILFLAADVCKTQSEEK